MELPSTEAPSSNSTFAPGSAVPLKTGVVTSVMSSVFELPVSLAGSRSGMEGAAGATLSIVTGKLPDVDVLPATSVDLALKLCTPLARLLAGMVQLLPVTTAVPSELVPSKSVMVVPFSQVPVSVGEVTLVIPSLLETPLSLAAVSCGIDGVSGAVVSIVTLNTADNALVFPAASLACTARLCIPSGRMDEVTLH